MPKKIEFAPGCFDSFEGTQEELDELVTEIKAMFEGDSLPGEEIDIEQLAEEDPEIAEKIFQILQDDEATRKLQ
jgi:hypothetical protein